MKKIYSPPLVFNLPFNHFILSLLVSNLTEYIERRETEPSYTRAPFGPIFQVAGKFCEWARKRNFEIQGKHRSVLPVRTFKKPKCRLTGNLCDLLIVRDIQMSVTTKRASKLNDNFSLVQLRVFVLICNPCFRLKYDLWITDSRLKIQIFLFRILLDESVRQFTGPDSNVFILHFPWRAINVRTFDHFMTDESQMSDLLHRLRSLLEQLRRNFFKIIISKIVIRSPFRQIDENQWSEIKLINRFQSIIIRFCDNYKLLSTQWYRLVTPLALFRSLEVILHK